MQKLRIYNSLTRRKENFKSRKGNTIGVYVCGITPYDITHLGHAFTYTFFDVLVRYLRHLGYRTTYVQNLTDVDDDLLKRAKESGKNWKKLAEKNTQKYLEDMNWLHNLQPDVYPRASDHIAEIIRIIRILERKKIAYLKNGNVYFQILADNDYGKLSKLSKKEMLSVASEHGSDSDDPNKKNPLDFILWQAKKPGEPAWSSPWDFGRPGWHIECTAMSMKYLGETFDIHGGGADLKFPHHESSIAQSETATGRQFVRYWMHPSMVLCDGVKMSKSLGNIVFIGDLKKKYNSNTIRIYLLSHHYRSVLDFNEKDIKPAQKTSELFRNVWLAQSEGGESLDISHYEETFYEAMNDDLNTPAVLKTLENLANQILKNHRKKNITNAKTFLIKALHILGLTIQYE